MECYDHSHVFVFERGYRVCKKCGIAIKEDYFSLEDSVMRIKRENANEKLRVRKRFSKNAYWNRIFTVENRYAKDNNHYEMIYFLRLANNLDLNEKQKKILYREFKRKKHRGYKEVCLTVFETICKHDMPITFLEYKKLVASLFRTASFLIKMMSYNKHRKYYWFIQKVLDNPSVRMSKEEKMKAYHIIRNYYCLIRFVLSRPYKPTALIRELAYRVIKKELGKTVNKEMYGIKSSTLYSTKLKHDLAYIKERNLDDGFNHKINFI